MSDLLEPLAEVAHQSWSDWMDYLFQMSRHNEDGSVTIPVNLVERWQRQVATKYADLSELEKNSDRAQARRMIAVLAPDGADA